MYINPTSPRDRVAPRTPRKASGSRSGDDALVNTVDKILEGDAVEFSTDLSDLTERDGNGGKKRSREEQREHAHTETEHTLDLKA